jgi:uncharacterized protein YjiS (DUF1127 family)
MTQAIIAAGNALHIDALLEFFRDIRRAYVRQKMINATIKELSKLTDRELNDIGIARGDIYYIAVTSYPKGKTAAECNDNLKGWV